jgi:hypothetical protein
MAKRRRLPAYTRQAHMTLDLSWLLFLLRPIVDLNASIHSCIRACIYMRSHVSMPLPHRVVSNTSVSPTYQLWLFQAQDSRSRVRYHSHQTPKIGVHMESSIERSGGEKTSSGRLIMSRHPIRYRQVSFLLRNPATHEVGSRKASAKRHTHDWGKLPTFLLLFINIAAAYICMSL